MSLSDVISTFNTGSYTVSRRAAGTVNSSGINVKATPTTFPIDASIRPMSGRDLKDVAEGRSADDYRIVHTVTQLFTVQGGQDIDVITIEGDRYRVKQVKHRTIFDDFYRCVVERLEVP